MKSNRRPPESLQKLGITHAETNRESHQAIAVSGSLFYQFFSPQIDRLFLKEVDDAPANGNTGTGSGQ